MPSSTVRTASRSTSGASTTGRRPACFCNDTVLHSRTGAGRHRPTCAAERGGWMSSGRPTLDDVAALAGVSRMTVSNAFNRPDQLSAATRLRVLESAAQLGYAGPDPAARSLRRGRAGAVGLLLTERLSYAFTDPGMVELLRGVAGALTDAGQGLLLVPT